MEIMRFGLRIETGNFFSSLEFENGALKAKASMQPFCHAYPFDILVTFNFIFSIGVFWVLDCGWAYLCVYAGPRTRRKNILDNCHFFAATTRSILDCINLQELASTTCCDYTNHQCFANHWNWIPLCDSLWSRVQFWDFCCRFL